MLGSKDLHKRRRYGMIQEDVSPMEGMANLVDVMLVFACGLMLALIINWNVDLTVVLDRDKLKEVDAEQVERNLEALSASRFEDLGNAFMDPETGKVYIISEAD